MGGAISWAVSYGLFGATTDDHAENSDLIPDRTDKGARLLPPTSRVEFSLNVISMHGIEDAHHSFTCNMLMHVKWNANLQKNGIPWYPWIQLHNLGDIVCRIDHDDNKGMLKWPEAKLQAKIEAEIKKNNGDINTVVPVLESTNLVATFITELDLRAYPFDAQKLHITFICNMTSDVNFTHRVVERDAEEDVTVDNGSKFKWKYPKPPHPNANRELLAAHNNRSIKCNLEGDTLSEWNIVELPVPPDSYINGVKPPKKYVTVYRFSEHDPLLSAEGKIYQRLNFYVVAHREFKNVLFSVMGPTAALCIGSLSIFSIDILEDGSGLGDRLSILFTIVLAIIANSIATQDRLPRVDYYTWASRSLNLMQTLVYLVVFESAIIRTLAGWRDRTIADLDREILLAIGIIYFLVFGYIVGSAFFLHHSRSLRTTSLAKADRRSFFREEERLFYYETGEKMSLIYSDFDNRYVFVSPNGAEDSRMQHVGLPENE